MMEKLTKTQKNAAKMACMYPFTYSCFTADVLLGKKYLSNDDIMESLLDLKLDDIKNQNPNWLKFTEAFCKIYPAKRVYSSNVKEDVSKICYFFVFPHYLCIIYLSDFDHNYNIQGTLSRGFCHLQYSYVFAVLDERL